MINSWLWMLLLSLFPMFAYADTAFTTNSSMSFTPPAGDNSIIFLGNIFGVVDGVLHGSGSQIMGTMLGVFNSAVIALGGIVIIYIVIVSTMNTAQDGEMLGHKWSSIWIPVRTIIGLSFLIPKASGYCMMQIFVMWVVVQGVGVADKIWGAALDYLNRGGVIIRANMTPVTSMDAGNRSIATGASVILYGQVCMLGIQTQLENMRNQYLDQANRNTGPCAGTPSQMMQNFCNTSVPDFINTVDPTAVQSAADSGLSAPSSYSVNMPNFSSGSLFASLNGICGQIHWNAVDTSTLTTNTVSNNGTQTQTSVISSLSQNDLDTVKMTRSIAISQMYTTLAAVARMMVDNDPQITVSNQNNAATNVSSVAKNQFGVPLSASLSLCAGTQDTCTFWGADPNGPSSSSVLLQGTEFQGAISDYNAVMAPTLNLMNQAKYASAANSAREFIQKSKQTGWILAGSYFFDLVKLNGSAMPSSTTDQGSGLDKSKFDISKMTSAFGSNNTCTSDYADLCTYLNKDSSKIAQVENLIDGSAQKQVNMPNLSSTTFPVLTGSQASTVFGYVDNAMNIDLPEQVGLTGPTIKLEVANLNFSPTWTMPRRHFSGYIINAKPLFSVSYQDVFGFLWNDILLAFSNIFLGVITDVLQTLWQVFIILPIQGFTYIFGEGVKAISAPGVNPIIGLANMGITYVNFAVEAWVAIAIATVSGALIVSIPYIGSAASPIFALIMIFMPLFLAWLGVMLGIAFITAYYVPFLPYMIFTFGAIAWLITVIEAMVAAPIVALGIVHPEGHDALGKSEQGLMILLNVFLRPPMMIIGYITAIALSYVSVWIMNAGFQHVLDYLQGPEMWGNSPMPWAKIFGYFFSSLLYISMYLTIVQKSFTLIYVLPDKVLRWIGGHGEQTGQESMQWLEEGKGQIKEGIEPTKGAAGQGSKQAAGQAVRMAGDVRDSVKKRLGGGGGGSGGMAGGA